MNKLLIVVDDGPNLAFIGRLKGNLSNLSELLQKFVYCNNIAFKNKNSNIIDKIVKKLESDEECLAELTNKNKNNYLFKFEIISQDDINKFESGSQLF